MITPDNWFDLAGLRLTSDGWSFASPIAHGELDDAAVHCELGPQGRYISSVRIWTGNEAARIEIAPTRDAGIGCRSVGIVLESLEENTDLDAFPRTIYLQAREGHFLARSLLSLWCLCSAEHRAAITEEHTFIAFPAQPKEKALVYETRAVEHLAELLPGYESLNPSELLLKKVRSSPDGLFYDYKEDRLIIVEVKKLAPGWADGGAQILQYIGQARHHSRFVESRVSTYLVADGQPTNGYQKWQQVLHDNRELKLYVAADSLERK